MSNPSSALGPNRHKPSQGHSDDPDRQSLANEGARSSHDCTLTPTIRPPWLRSKPDSWHVIRFLIGDNSQRKKERKKRRRKKLHPTLGWDAAIFSFFPNTGPMYRHPSESKSSLTIHSIVQYCQQSPVPTLPKMKATWHTVSDAALTNLLLSST